jgi:hypothetical protein
VLGVDFVAIRVQLVMVELGEVEEMSGFELIMPGPAGAGLVKQESLLALLDALVIVYLDLPEEQRYDFDIVFGPARWGEPSGIMAVAVQELLPVELVVGQRVCVRTIGRGGSQGKAVVAGLSNVPEVLVDGFLFVGCSAALDCEIPERDVFELPELFNSIRGGVLHGHGMAFGLEVNGGKEGHSFVCSLEREAFLFLGLWWW